VGHRRKIFYHCAKNAKHAKKKFSFSIFSLAPFAALREIIRIGWGFTAGISAFAFDRKTPDSKR
jgi:hypothetical protein